MTRLREWNEPIRLTEKILFMTLTLANQRLHHCLADMIRIHQTNKNASGKFKKIQNNLNTI